MDDELEKLLQDANEEAEKDDKDEVIN